MARLTKNSYKRKIILFGLLVFMSIALISTGFAAWVMSTNANNDDINGNVTVGVVKDASLTISDVIIKSDAKSFKFEPQDTDNSGRVRFDSSATEAESLKITIEGKISPIEYLGKLNYELLIPESVKKAAQDGYIVLPECVSENGYVVDSNTINSSNANASNISFTKDEENVDGVQVRYAIFSYDITFEWGNAFKLAASDLTGIETEGLLDVANYDVVRVGEQDVHVAKNPWIYYEEVMSKITKYEEQVKFAEVAGAKIDAFRKVIYGIDDAETSYDDVPAENKTFNITIIASTAALASDQQSQ